MFLESYKAKETVSTKRKVGAKSQKTAAKVALMKMKMKALGDKGIPQVGHQYCLKKNPKNMCLGLVVKSTESKLLCF